MPPSKPQVKACPVPFLQRTERHVQISLEAFWEFARWWACSQGYAKEEGGYPGLPPF